MKRLQLLVLMQLFCSVTLGLNVTIIESQSYMFGHNMDMRWKNVLVNMGHNPVILPQSTLDNNAFFSTTDLLIVSSGVIDLPTNRVNTIIEFLQSGKPVYLQSEHLPTYSTNQAFKTIVNSFGGTFNWNNPFEGSLYPTNVLGTFGTTNNTVKTLNVFHYSVSGSGDCNIINFLEYAGEYHGFQYVPANTAYGTIITCSDQDWIKQSANPELMENIITHLIFPPHNHFNFSFSLGKDTTMCFEENLILDATYPHATYVWQDYSTKPTLKVSRAGIYWVEVTLKNCISSDTILIAQENCELYMPNVITPNNDGVNDILIPVVGKGIVAMHTRIYNKWGNKIFETHNPLIEWDGQESSDGTYFLIATYTDINGKQNKLKGYITLLK